MTIPDYSFLRPFFLLHIPLRIKLFSQQGNNSRRSFGERGTWNEATDTWTSKWYAQSSTCTVHKHFTVRSFAQHKASILSPVISFYRIIHCLQLSRVEKLAIQSTLLHTFERETLSAKSEYIERLWCIGRLRAAYSFIKCVAKFYTGRA